MNKSQLQREMSPCFGLEIQKARDSWLETTLTALPNGSSLLDVGAGECAYKPFCGHLDYTSQDIAQYDGQGDGVGLHTQTWDFRQIDMVCDVYDIPEDKNFDYILCSEVLEHVVDPVRAIEKMARICKPGGSLIITAPINSLTHFAPYHYCTGFSRYFYTHHLERLGFTLETLAPNGGYFDMMAQELGRMGHVRKTYSGWPLDPISWITFAFASISTRILSIFDGPARKRKSSELQCFGWHVVARKLETTQA